MKNPARINVKSLDPKMQDFFLFQKPARFSTGGAVYSNALTAWTLTNFATSGFGWTINLELTNYAFMERTPFLPQIGDPSGWYKAYYAIDLATANGWESDMTTAHFEPIIGLSQPVNARGVPVGAFRIAVPGFTAPPFWNFGCGFYVDFSMVMSSFVTLKQADTIDCFPDPIFYIQKERLTSAGTVVDFAKSAANAAVIDFSGGKRLADVTYNANGTFSTEMK